MFGYGVAALALALLASPDLASPGETALPRSAAYERFRYAFFEDPNSARDVLDVAALLALKDEERTLAETDLIGFLPDGRAVIGLGALRSQGAEPRLREIFEAERRKAELAYANRETSSNHYLLIWVSRALWQIRPNPAYSQALIGNLRFDPSDDDRELAASELAQIPAPEVDRALPQALDDPDPLVRYHVARALLRIHGLSFDPTDLKTLPVLLMSSDPARREAAKQNLLAMIAGRPLGLLDKEAEGG